MAEKITLDLHQLQVASFATNSDFQQAPVDGPSSPDVCTCIDICAPTEDVYCSGGC